MKSFIHIRDVVAGLMLAMEKQAMGTFHLSDPSDTTIRQVVALVCQQMGKPFDDVVRIVGERPGQDSRYWLDCTRAHQELGWRPVVKFDDGVRETLAWIDRHWDVLQHQPMDYIHHAAG